MPRRTHALRLILKDQLSQSLSSLRDIDRDRDVVLMVEAHDELTFVRHHKQKIVLILSAMRHFANELRANGIRVDYVTLTDSRNTGSISSELNRAIGRHRPKDIIMTEPSEWRVQAMICSPNDFIGSLQVLPDDRYICDRARFAGWAKRRKTLRMESFYHEMRRGTGWLMRGDSPEGDRWNYDVENRRSLHGGVRIPAPPEFETDVVTREIIDLVEERYKEHFGDLEPFSWGTTRTQALEALRHFVKKCLPDFGYYQDAMMSAEPRLFHSALSPYLNLGLLEPREVCEAALREYESGRAPLNSVEGFIRQILGWREYVRGVYWLKMPEYSRGNYLSAKRKLPSFYWTGRTDMVCLRRTIEDTRRNAYAHHIQRLMLTGNFALLAGLRPSEVEEWYLVVYADAYDWVELPNTHGMALYADGGLLASKPYAASASYINRMSDFCRDCSFDHRRKLGKGACPFNYLYWYFLIQNEERLAANPRMAMPYNTLRRMEATRRTRIVQDSESFLDGLETHRRKRRRGSSSEARR